MMILRTNGNICKDSVICNDKRITMTLSDLFDYTLCVLSAIYVQNFNAGINKGGNLV